MSTYPVHRSPAVDELPLFAKPAPNLAEGLRRKEEALSRVESNNPTLFQRLLTFAKTASALKGSAHNDDVRAMAMIEGLDVPSKLYGVIWSRKGWRKIGERASSWPACHAKKSGVYVWEGE